MLQGLWSLDFSFLSRKTRSIVKTLGLKMLTKAQRFNAEKYIRFIPGDSGVIITSMRPKSPHAVGEIVFGEKILLGLPESSIFIFLAPLL